MLTDLLEKHAPLQKVKTRSRPTAPWFDAECRVAKARTRRFEKEYRRQPSVETRSAWRAQFTNQRTIYQQKFVNHWSAAISSCRGDSKALWSRLRPLLQPGTVATSQLTANDFAQFFTDKIERIRASTATARPPTIEDRHVPEPLSNFWPTTANDMMVI